MSAVAIVMREDAHPKVDASGLAEVAERAVRHAAEASADRKERSRDVMGLVETVQSRMDAYEDTIASLRADLGALSEKHSALVQERVVSEMTHFQAAETLRKDHAAEIARMEEEHASALSAMAQAHREEMERFQQGSIEAVRRFRASAEDQIALANKENARLDAENLRLCEDNRQLAESVARLVDAIETNVASMRREDETFGVVMSGIVGSRGSVVPFPVPAVRD